MVDLLILAEIVFRAQPLLCILAMLWRSPGCKAEVNRSMRGAFGHPKWPVVDLLTLAQIVFRA